MACRACAAASAERLFWLLRVRNLLRAHHPETTVKGSMKNAQN